MFEKIGIVCAVPQEAQPFIAAMQESKLTKRSLISVYDGILCGKKAAVVCCGVGKVNAAAAVQRLIDCFGVDAVIMAGTAGSIDVRPNIADIIAVESSAYHDMAENVLKNFYPFFEDDYFYSDKALLEAAQKAAESFSAHKVFCGTAVSGDVFIAQEGRDSIIERFSPMSVDMETAAAAQVCTVNGIAFFAVRSVSDTPHESGVSSFEQNLGTAAQSAFEFTAAMLKYI